MEIKQLLCNAWVIFLTDVSREIIKYFELNENENTTYQNVWDIMKAVLRGRIITLNTYIRKERPKINNLSFHLKKEEQYKLRKRKLIIILIIKFRAHNATGNKKSIGKANKIKS